MNRLLRILPISVTTLCLTLACGDDDEPSDTMDGSAEEDAGPEPIDPHEIPDSGSPGKIKCAELGSICHDFDRGTGDLGDQCHDVGHAGDVEECEAMYDECIAYCRNPVEGDGGTDASTDGSIEPGNDGSVSLCEELGHLCHDLDDGGPGLAHDCHEVGHAGDVAACATIYSSCIEHCGDDHHD